MRVISRIALALAGFLLVASAVYGFTNSSEEVGGAALLFVSAATFCYLGIVARNAARGGWPGDEEEGAAVAEEPDVAAPTIWPLGFSIAAVLLVLSAIVSPWILVVAVPAFAASAAGWLREVAKAHRDQTRA